MKLRWAFGVGMAVFSSLAACNAAPDSESVAESNVTGTSDCDVIDQRTGTKLTVEQLSKLSDPVAKQILDGKGCPSSFKDVTEKLDRTDSVGPIIAVPGVECAPGCIWSRDCATSEEFAVCTVKGGACTMENRCDPVPMTPCTSATHFVSETAQVLNGPDRYRAVLSRRCGGRQEQDLLMSVFGISASAQSLPGSVELIGHDRTAGVFNFYAREDNTWKFFGSSKDFVSAGYECRNGACESKAAGKQRCAGCHSGGGLVMKELESPWVHWEGLTSTPGTEDLITRFAGQLGRLQAGIDLEGVVEAGNGDWTAKRLDVLKEQGVKELLRPLFCTLDVNLQTASATDEVQFLRPDLFVDPQWRMNGGAAVSNADYIDLRIETNQRIEDARGTRLVSKAKGPVSDTFFPFIYPVRSRAGADTVFLRELLAKGIVDEDFVSDVLHVDFTRPIFSEPRCQLLDAAPTLSVDQLTPAAIRDGFIANLAGKPGAAAALLANLKTQNDSATHKAEVEAYLAACRARPKKDFLRDSMVHASQLRNRFRDLRIAEFTETLTVDDIPDGDRRFDPKTCVLNP